MAKKESANLDPPIWERAVGLLGFALICGVFTYLAWSAMTQERGPPRIVFEVLKISSLNPGFVVQIRVDNTGKETAAMLQVEGQLEQINGRKEKAKATLDYVPPGSSREIGLFFDSDPRAGNLTLRALSYKKP